MKSSLSVILVCLNEADRVRACLESVADIADEIIVLDSGSTDDTVNICREFTPHVVETDWPGYGPQKQRALARATCDWVLSVDADERVSPELRGRIRQILGQTCPQTAWKIRIIAEAYGRSLKYGRTTKFGLRLFRRAGARFNEKAVHEHVIPAPGSIGKLNEPIHHQTYRDYRHAMEKMDHYAWLWALERFERGQRSGPASAVLHAVANFVKVYFFRRGFLDGRHGLIVAVQFSIYTFNKYAALWSITEQARDMCEPRRKR